MTHWAILSGLEGNLAAYEAVLQDLQRQRQTVDELYVLGDVVAPTATCDRLIQRLQSPRPQELVPQVCQGWWEEQLLILHGLGRQGEPTELIERYGMDKVKLLWDSMPRSVVNWVRSLDFGFVELDCLLIHGSSISASDELTPETEPMQLLDRLLRMEVDTLFCGRSGLAFQYEIHQGEVNSSLTQLDQAEAVEAIAMPPRQVVGVGAVGRIPGQASYTLYDTDCQQVQFKTVRYGAGRGFKGV